MRVGPLVPGNRDRIPAILRASGVFRDAEIDVALELFDEAHPGSDAAPASSDYVFLGAFTPEDELAGFACYGPTPETDRTYDLYWIAVDPMWQGTGGGSILLTEVERRLEGLNARLVVVETSSRSDYAAAQRFYVRHGYVETARARGFYAPADDRITFTKRMQSRGAPSGRVAHGATA